MNERNEPKKPGERLIVTSAHLASKQGAGLSEFEFGLNLANNSFHRWMVQCMTASGLPDLSPLDIQVLHLINHRDRSKRLSDLCMLLNIDDTHTVSYALRKLLGLGLIVAVKKGNEKLFKASASGTKVCLEYREVREQCLVSSLSTIGDSFSNLHELAKTLRALSGFYDQAARAAASM
ncbi:MAG: winged helix DNA-binding protein [Dehalococcoidia bacterium]